MKNLVVLGGGYGGMRILQRILPHLPEDRTVTLIDRSPYHCLKTEYYALAAGTVSDQEVRVSFPEHERLTIAYGEITEISLEERKVYLNDKEPVSYDDLVIGLGCEDKYHNVPGADVYTLSIQTIEKSRTTYQVLNNLAPGARVGIVGAGLSGVELASELNESRPDLNVVLFDRGEHILSAFSERLSKYVQSWFTKHNVEIVNKANITRVEENLLYNHDEPLPFDAIVWTAGIQPNKLVRDLDVEKDRQGRVILTPQHFLPGRDDVFVVGDCASLPHAPSAQLAEEQAEQIADILKRKWAGKPIPETLPSIKMKGTMGSLGSKHGFGLVNDTPVTGRVARLIKSGILWMYKYHNG
ncbi:NAD(P)/FAD-dependent oxidoreductase [Peribacillus kribbensis]|uniref:NAD(P)/FAD-dependent oxidoreductase n=1 Tax=Peribacillus kribbensis TaxID=356658 RepID=UPI0003FEE4F3|nr:NAD(P)/FAD-dependent oxidoreductase [Peribacillus kribbensis]